MTSADLDATARATGLPRTRWSLLSRFASVGVVNTVVDFGLYVTLVSLGLGAVPANFISTAAGMAVSFAGNRRFVFGTTSNRTREILLFIAVCGTGVWVIQPAVILGVGATISAATSLPALSVQPLSKAAAIVVAAAWNFVLYRRLVFRAATAREKGPKRS